jgi:CheY-like chemotaxis protein
MFVEIPNGDVGLKSVLILEDEAMLSMQMDDIVRDLGVETVHVASKAKAAKEVVATAKLDCAVLDVRVRDGDCAEVADMLMLRGVPFVFSTGMGIDSLPERHRHLPLIKKPFSDDELRVLLLDTVAATRALRHPGSAAGPLPGLPAFSQAIR